MLGDLAYFEDASHAVDKRAGRANVDHAIGKGAVSAGVGKSFRQRNGRRNRTDSGDEQGFAFRNVGGFRVHSGDEKGASVEILHACENTCPP